ncbi:MAG: hypothetical protein C5B43_04010 [Verrucomicrobia bacterium]|nr:MAG: hypothetical protein C5B43_04010 [Verrucomicrobiota bacterium]
MSIDFMSVRKSLYDWTVANIPNGMPVVYLYPNAPRPTVDYVSLLISSVTQIGWDYIQDPLTNAGISEQVGDREFTLQIQAYGGDPITVLQNLRTSLQKQTVLDTLRANGIAFACWHPINDITDIIDSRYEQRATMDVLFRIADVYSDISGVISNAVVQEVYQDAIGNIIYDETFTIPPL